MDADAMDADAMDAGAMDADAMDADASRSDDDAVTASAHEHRLDFDRAVNIDRCDPMKSNENKRKNDDEIVLNGGKWNETKSAFKRFKRQQVKPIAQYNSMLPSIVEEKLNEAENDIDINLQNLFIKN